MRLKHGLVIGLLAGALTAGGTLAVHEMAAARQRPIVVVRYLMGFFNARGRFVPTAGRNATEVDRNAIALFVFSGAVDSGPNLRATLPCTLAELGNTEECSLDSEDIEPGVIPRRRSPFRGGRIVATGSINSDSVRIAAQGVGGSETLASGAFFKVTRGRRARRTIRNRLLFNPRFVQATFNRPAEIDYNPEGFAASTEFSVRMEGGDEITNAFTTVRNVSGTVLAAPFQATFTTGDGYVQDFTRPLIRSISPGDGAVNVPSDADIDITFSEPMDLTTFQPLRFVGDDSATIVVTFSLSAINGANAGRRILGTVRVKPQTAGNVVQFRPLQGFGQGPAEVTATISNGVTDLSGNNIIRQTSFTFTTENDPNAENFGEVEEDFVNTTQRDDQFTQPSGDNLIAEWNNPEGFLSTTVNELTFDTQGPNPNTSLNLWNRSPLLIQLLFPATDFGNRPRTITQFQWFTDPPATNANSNLTYPNTIIRMGHATDLIAGGGFPDNIAPQESNFRDVPVDVAPSQSYSVVPADANDLIPGPNWSRSFDYDGSNAVIMELSHNGNGSAPPVPPATVAPSDFWLVDSNYVINGITALFTASNPQVIVTQKDYYSVRWTFLTPGAEAESNWYDITIDQLRYQAQQVIPINQPQGTSIAIQWQGAKGDAANTSVLDTSSITDWKNDIRELANNRYVRFRVTFTNNLQTRATPSIDKLIIPYTFR